MTIYYNNPPVRLAIADGMPPLTRPLIGPADEDVEPGTRLYSLFDYSQPDARLLVTQAGHWYHLGSSVDTDGAGDWVCRGCRTSAKTGRLLDEQYGRCPKPPQGQDIASALLGRPAVSV